MPVYVPNKAPVDIPTANPIIAPNLIRSKQLGPLICLPWLGISSGCAWRSCKGVYKVGGAEQAAIIFTHARACAVTESLHDVFILSLGSIIVQLKLLFN